jgi:uncharacterized protein (UPF0333 family)
MKNKGQAAMEFLMTYGWAILAAVIAIGALAYLGVFSPETSDYCVISAPFSCDESAIGTDIQLNIRNGGGQSLTINNITIDGCTSYTTVTPVADGATTGAITVTCGLNPGDQVNKNIKISYIKSGGAINQTVSGSIRGKV